MEDIKQEIISYMFGELTYGFIVSFYLFALLGMTLNMLFHLKGKEKRVRNRGLSFQYNFWYWLKDNTVRGITNMILIFVFMRFYNEYKDGLAVQLNLGMFLSFILGFGFDKAIVYIRRKTAINIFQSKENDSDNLSTH